ncbi:cytosine deaminase [Cenarchaeum symbiosum A]|uniref:Cytosine deaminase n=1 Tax=Cenarchaeum symbiosum (strain A) TaxID=414004 RepID=A0RYF2_CENSY|nr:cytosine deaminase [Cenarchaeum symbiosum A]
MILRNVGALVGGDLEYVQSTDIRITRGRFGAVRPGQAGPGAADCEGLLAMPGLVNAHTHIGDSIAKDAAPRGTVDDKIHPVHGAKARILSRTRPEHLAAFMRNSCISMIRGGTTAFADFREGGPAGIALAKRALAGLPIRRRILGRAGLYQDWGQIGRDEGFPRGRRAELDRVLRECDGLGISGANENSDSVLRSYSRTKKLRAIHSSETEQSIAASRAHTKRSEAARALQLRPHFMVHMTHASRADLRAVARSCGIVVCPRANAALAEGIPDIHMMLKEGCRVAIGTDNVMVNPPDMFREMDYLWKVTMAVHKKRIDPREILQMATVNGGSMLGLGAGPIEAGMLADCILIEKHSIDLEPLHDPHAAIVHRASAGSVRAVIIGGRIAHGRI